MVAGVELEGRVDAPLGKEALDGSRVIKHGAHHAVGGLVLLFAEGEIGGTQLARRHVLAEVVGESRKPQGSRSTCHVCERIALGGCPERKEAGERVAHDAAPSGRNGKFVLCTRDDNVQEFLQVRVGFSRKRLGVAHGSLAGPGTELAVPIEAADRNEGERWTAELGVRAPDVFAASLEHVEVDQGHGSSARGGRLGPPDSDVFLAHVPSLSV